MSSLSLLIGSGVSYYSEIPSITKITDLVLSGKNITRETDSHYYINKSINPLNQNHNKQYVTNNIVLLKELVSAIDEFYSHMNYEHECNYEDIYFVNRQICDSYLFEYENPAIIKLIKYLKKKFDISDDELKEISIETAQYIECVVWRMINREISVFDQFDIINHLIKNYSLISIMSLNHDLAIEKYLTCNNIEYDDGFEVRNRKLPEWRSFKNNDPNLKLLKLHGSINWFSVQLRDSIKRNTIMRVPNNIYPERLYEVHNSIDIGIGRPELLIGTFNKMWGYLSGIFEEQYFAFINSLSSTSIVLVSGYGFGDKGINTKLHNWLNSTHSSKMIIIHPNKRNLVNNARGIFPHGFMSLRGIHPKILFIEKKFEDVQIEEIHGVL
ncbi:MAG: hypothetical protein GWP19_15055 [Planctomycetia bacterium]|nr:hypothetical protein [Planctomycetia bacterium]